MFKLKDNNTAFRLSIDNFPKELNFGNNIYTEDPLVHNIITLKSNLDFIPIICVNHNDDIALDKESFNKELLKTINMKATRKNILDDIFFVKSELDNIYDKVITKTGGNYSRNLLLRPSVYSSKNTSVSNYENYFLSNNYKLYIPVDNGKIILSTFYYTYNNRILFTLVVNKNKIIEFKKNIFKGIIDPSHCEIWVDKKFIKEKDRKMFNRWLKNDFIMTLIMNGFKVIEKDNILNELVYISNYKFKSPQDISEFRSKINKLLLNV